MLASQLAMAAVTVASEPGWFTAISEIATLWLRSSEALEAQRTSIQATSAS